MPAPAANPERVRLDDCTLKDVPWKRWGPYLSERQWGTVREDYSDNGAAWDYFPHDQARSRAYRWGEDGIAGYSDEVGTEVSRRLASIFLQDASGKRPVFGDATKFQNDPHWRDYIHFFEYFHGDTGEGLGASHQTGWTGLAARFVQALHMDPLQTLQSGIRLVPKAEEAKKKTVGL